MISSEDGIVSMTCFCELLHLKLVRSCIQPSKHGKYCIEGGPRIYLKWLTAIRLISSGLVVVKPIKEVNDLMTLYEFIASATLWKYALFLSPCFSQLILDFCLKYDFSINLKKVNLSCRSFSLWNKAVEGC